MNLQRAVFRRFNKLDAKLIVSITMERNKEK